MPDVYILGAYSTPFGKRPADTFRDLTRETYLGVLADAGAAAAQHAGVAVDAEQQTQDMARRSRTVRQVQVCMTNSFFPPHPTTPSDRPRARSGVVIARRHCLPLAPSPPRDPACCATAPSPDAPRRCALCASKPLR